MRGEHEDADLREFRANRLRSLQTLGRMRGGHANVQHDQLWTVLTNQPHQLRRIDRQTDDLKVRRFEQASDALAQEEVVVCDHHTEVSHGRRRHFPTRVQRVGDLAR
jgi:1,4-alpha-glucan branching enzyme